jgi:hypothetical protein
MKKIISDWEKYYQPSKRQLKKRPQKIKGTGFAKQRQVVEENKFYLKGRKKKIKISL